MNIEFDNLPKRPLTSNLSFAKKILSFYKKLKEIIFEKEDPKSKKHISINAIEYLQIGVPEETKKNNKC